VRLTKPLATHSSEKVERKSQTTRSVSELSLLALEAATQYDSTQRSYKLNGCIYVEFQQHRHHNHHHHHIRYGSTEAQQRHTAMSNSHHSVGDLQQSQRCAEQYHATRLVLSVFSNSYIFSNIQPRLFFDTLTPVYPSNIGSCIITKGTLNVNETNQIKVFSMPTYKLSFFVRLYSRPKRKKLYLRANQDN